MKYKSKIAWWMYFTLFLCIAPMAIVLVEPISNIWAVVVTIIVLLLMGYFIFYLMYYTCYTVVETSLNISMGRLSSKTIDIHSISKIKETNDPLSAAAMSLDRLLIKHKNGSDLISPLKKHEFVKHLQSINPAIIFIAKK